MCQDKMKRAHNSKVDDTSKEGRKKLYRREEAR